MTEISADSAMSARVRFALKLQKVYVVTSEDFRIGPDDLDLKIEEVMGD